MTFAPTITARVYGGLGNQCFIYAAARAMADRAHGLLVLDPTILTLDKVYRRPLHLSEFNIRASHIVRGRAAFWKLYTRRMHMRLRQRLPWQSSRWIFERPQPRFQPEMLGWRGTQVVIDGYWQTEKYFDDVVGSIATDLVPLSAEKLERSPMAAHIAACANSVFLHVRSYREVPGRQDGSFALPASYFQNAVALVRSHIPDAHFFIFSDDIDWAGRRLKLAPDIPCTAVLHDTANAPSPLLDFHLMTLCRHAIVANSSFSWWPAWLGEQRRHGQDPPALIVRPAGACPNADYYPGRWKTVGLS